MLKTGSQHMDGGLGRRNPDAENQSPASGRRPGKKKPRCWRPEIGIWMEAWEEETQTLKTGVQHLDGGPGRRNPDAEDWKSASGRRPGKKVGSTLDKRKRNRKRDRERDK